MNSKILRFENETSKIKDNIEYIRRNISKIDRPILIELIGTAKSGKTTLTNYLTQLFDKHEIPIQSRQETAEYNPIENKDIEEYNIWMFMELMKNLSEDISNKTPRVVVYDRGVLDRIPWIDFSTHEGSIPMKDNQILKQLYESEFLQAYKPLTYGFVTSPEISVIRKGKEGRLVNLRNVKLFNECFEQEYNFINSRSKKYTTIQTDQYQGDIQSFIIDTISTILEDVKEQIKEIEFGAVGGERTKSCEEDIGGEREYV